MTKPYMNEGRKPMMCGGDTTRQKKSYGGSTRKKMAKGDLTDERRQALIKQRAQLQAAVEKGGRPADILQQMRMDIIRITDELGESATPGRASIDAPQGNMYGGMAKKRK